MLRFVVTPRWPKFAKRSVDGVIIETYSASNVEFEFSFFYGFFFQFHFLILLCVLCSLFKIFVCVPNRVPSQVARMTTAVQRF